MTKQERAGKAIERFTQGRQRMLEALGEAQSILGDELESREKELSARLGPGKKVETLPHAGTAGRGKLTRSNDRALFFWVGVAVTDGKERREYLIDLFHNEVDGRSGNFHSQIGHFQFAALQPVAPGEKGASPHVAGDDGHWRFLGERLEDPRSSLCDYGEAPTELGPFDPVGLVDAFLGFVAEWESA